MFAPPVKAPKANSASQTTPTHAAKLPQDRPVRPGLGSAGQILGLQRTIGNQAVLGLLAQRSESVTESKSVGPRMREADRGRMSSPEAVRSASRDFGKIPVFPHGRADRLSSPAGATQAPGPSKPGVDGVGDQLMRMPGEPLEPGVRREAERRFGHDFGNVRVQRGRKAAEATSAVGALAFTLGRHIVAQDGAIDPATAEGHAILFHELTHIVQQAAFDDHDLVGAPVLDAAHSSEQEARAGTAAPSPLAAPASAS